MVEVDSGIAPDYDIEPRKALVIVAFTAIALYNVFELTCIIFGTFKKRRGLYFWSFCVASWSIAPYSIGFLLKHLSLSNVTYLNSTLIVFGWSGMVTGQSVVLYSRLHLLDRNVLRLRLVLALIIFNAIAMHIPIAVMVYGSNGSNPEPWLVPYTIYEKVQVAVFFVQEVIISILYITATVRMFKFEGALRGRRPGKVLRHLLWVNVFIIVLDITILFLEFAGYYDLQTSYKGLVYSIKLKMEFSILNSLIDITKSGSSGGAYHSSSADGRDYFAGIHGSRSNPRGTNNDSTVVALETFDGGLKSAVRRKGSVIHDGVIAELDEEGRATPGPGYSAMVKTQGGQKDARADAAHEGIMVSTTTEVSTAVNPDAEWGRGHTRRPPSENDTEPDMAEPGPKSSSSSEVGFAKSAY